MPNCIGNWLHRPWLHLILDLFGMVLTTVRTGPCATLWLPNAGWPTEWRYAQYGEEDKMKMVRRQFLHLAGAATALFAYVVRASTSALDPARVGSPATSNRSLMANDRAIERIQSHAGTRSRIGCLGGVAGDLRIEKESVRVA